MEVKPVAILFALVLAVPGVSPGAIIGFTNASAVASFQPLTMEQIGRMKWFYAHASVGEYMLDGLTRLHDTNPSFYRLYRSPCDGSPTNATQAGMVYDLNHGNPGWELKEAIFETKITAGWRYPQVDFVMNKLCFVDSDTPLASYVASMAELEANYPYTRVVYATMPLETLEDEPNYKRNLFNNALRTWIRTSVPARILFDVADIEAHDTHGVEQTFLYNGMLCQKLCAEYALYDTGHPAAVFAEDQLARGFYGVAAAFLGLDSDQDGMPDWWEIANGFGPLYALDAKADPDQDGMTNLAEYLSGTAPYNPQSVLRLKTAGGEGGVFQMEFFGCSNINYTVEANADSVAAPNSWQTVARISSQPSERNVLVVDSYPRAKCFYRVKAQRAP